MTIENKSLETQKDQHPESQHDEKLEIGIKELNRIEAEQKDEVENNLADFQKESHELKNTINTHTDTSHFSVNAKKSSDSNINSSVLSTIETKNPDSSPIANAGREKSYSIVQSQISSLPFGLDRFFADA